MNPSKIFNNTIKVALKTYTPKYVYKNSIIGSQGTTQLNISKLTRNLQNTFELQNDFKNINFIRNYVSSCMNIEDTAINFNKNNNSNLKTNNNGHNSSNNNNKFGTNNNIPTEKRLNFMKYRPNLLYGKKQGPSNDTERNRERDSRSAFDIGRKKTEPKFEFLRTKISSNGLKHQFIVEKYKEKSSISDILKSELLNIELINRNKNKNKKTTTTTGTSALVVSGN